MTRMPFPNAKRPAMRVRTAGPTNGKVYSLKVQPATLSLPGITVAH